MNAICLSSSFRSISNSWAKIGYVPTLLLLLAILQVVMITSLADETTHQYKDEEELAFYANKIGPFNNPLETYAYFEMPGCNPASWEHKYPSIGQALSGDELYPMSIDAKFKHDVMRRSICKLTPTASDIMKWKDMVKEQYWYQLYVDDLPVWATLGKIIKDDPFIFTHQHFRIGYNGNRIVQVNLTADTPVNLNSAKEFEFMYTVEFKEQKHITFENRFDRYLDDEFFEHRVHWFSITNSFMLVFFLVVVVLLILHRTLKADFVKFVEDRAASEIGKEDWIEDSGWKQLSNDVFRVPYRPVMLCVLVGTGCQIGILILSLTVISIVSVVYTTPGTFASYAVLCFVVTSYAAGFFSATQFSWYALIGPTISSQWIQCMLATATLFPGTILCAGFLLNFVAIAYDSAQAIPFGGMVVLLCLWLCVSFPLVVLGTVVGRHARLFSSPGGGSRMVDVPRVNQIPRMIPNRRWVVQRPCLVLMGGILPFFSIFIELYFIYTSFWNHKVYYVYGFMLLVVCIFMIVTACVSIVCVYCLLNSEDHRWQWTSFWIGASTSVYVFLYSVYFYFIKTHMTGFFMFSFYFTYTFMICFAIAILSGTISYMAASKFVFVIYRTIKMD